MLEAFFSYYRKPVTAHFNGYLRKFRLIRSIVINPASFVTDR